MKTREEEILDKMQSLIDDLDELTPKERGEIGRYYHVVITEMEKVLAYFKTYIADR